MFSFKTFVTFSLICGVASVFYVTTHTATGQSNSVSVIKSTPPNVTLIKNQQISEPYTPPTQEVHQVAKQTEERPKPDRPLRSIPKEPVAQKAVAVAPEINQYSFKAFAQNVHAQTNALRRKNNLPAFTYDETLTELATKRSLDMATHNYFSHTSPDGCDLTCRFEKAQYITFSFGENLAMYSDYELLSEAELTEYFINKWLKSSGHKKNLLSSDFTNEGIGIALQGKKIIVTVIFAKS